MPALQAGTTTKGDYLKAYGDVEEAFDAFLHRIGPDRAFVLMGHSQGAYHLQRLIRRRIDGNRKLPDGRELRWKQKWSQEAIVA